jgi:DNA-binding IclR family transcriptional regulator
MHEARVSQAPAAKPWPAPIRGTAGIDRGLLRPTGDRASVYQVRSAARSVEVLEYFRMSRQPARAKDIGFALGLSPSSTSDLLKTLVEVGYLRFDERSKLYFVGPRAVLFANWLANQQPGLADLVDLSRSLSEQTGECVVVAAQRGWRIQFLTVLHGPEPTPPEVAEGLTAPLLSTAMGMAILMRSSGAELIETIRRIYKVKSCQPIADALVRQLRAFERRGYACVPEGGVLSQYGRIAVALSSERFGVPMAIGIGGPEKRIRAREAELAGIIRTTMKELIL